MADIYQWCCCYDVDNGRRELAIGVLFKEMKTRRESGDIGAGDALEGLIGVIEEVREMWGIDTI